MLHSCFPERLKSLRQEKNMLQQDLADHLKVSKSTISGWEVGRNQPDYDTLIELSIFFGVSVDYLIGLTKTRIAERVSAFLLHFSNRHNPQANMYKQKRRHNLRLIFDFTRRFLLTSRCLSRIAPYSSSSLLPLLREFRLPRSCHPCRRRPDRDPQCSRQL